MRKCSSFSYGCCYAVVAQVDGEWEASLRAQYAQHNITQHNTTQHNTQGWCRTIPVTCKRPPRQDQDGRREEGAAADDEEDIEDSRAHNGAEADVSFGDKYMKEVKSSGAEPPAAMNVAPATSSEIWNRPAMISRLGAKNSSQTMAGCEEMWKKDTNQAEKRDHRRKHKGTKVNDC